MLDHGLEDSTSIWSIFLLLVHDPAFLDAGLEEGKCLCYPAQIAQAFGLFLMLNKWSCFARCKAGVLSEFNIQKQVLNHMTFAFFYQGVSDARQPTTRKMEKNTRTWRCEAVMDAAQLCTSQIL
jgi:hypothetical protein